MASKKKKKSDHIDRPRPTLDFEAIRRMDGRNFRDLGGLPWPDGRRVRQRRFYRSAHLAQAPDEHPLRVP